MTVHVVPTEVVPGRPSPVTVRIVNDGDSDRAFVVRMVGLADSWVSPPALTDPVPAGREAVAELTVTLPQGFPASRLAVEVVAEPIDGAPAQRADLELVVGDGEHLRLGLEPADVRGGRRRSFDVRLTNHGPRQLHVELDAEVPAGRLDLGFDPPATAVPPGATVRARGTVRGRRPVAGRPRRLPFVVSARGAITPVHAEGSFTQSPILSAGVLKVLAVVAVLSLWMGAMAFALERFGSGEDEEATTGATPAAAEGGDAGAGGEDGGGQDGGSDQEGGAEAEGGGYQADGAGQDDGSESEDGGDGQAAAGAKVGGTVKAKEPGGVTVRIEPISLVDERAATATLVGFQRSPSTGKRAGPTVDGHQPARTTVTDDAGVWAFAGVQGPGYFLVTFTKPGYSQRSYVVQVDEGSTPVELDVLLEAGAGTISGTVAGADGPLGGVDISVSDGTVTLGTRTPTTGDGVGTFTVEGLTTPGTYLVTASRRGYGTQTALVDLGGGEAASVDLTLTAGVGTVTGVVRSDDGPLGGVTVSITDGTTTRTATTLTEGPVGSYTLPQLPIPGTYTLTVEGDGWATSTREVELTGDADIPVVLEPTTGAIFGRITDADGDPMGGVGVTLEGEGVVVKNTSVEDPPGAYELVGVPPGTYVVSFTRFGFETESTVVELGPGEERRLDVRIDDPIDVQVPQESRITGRVVDATTSNGIGGATITVTGETSLAPITALSDGSFSITGLPPGVFTLKVEASGYEPVTERVTLSVESSATVSVRLFPLASIEGVVRSNADGSLLAGATLCLLAAGSPPPGATCTGQSLTTDPQGAFRFERSVQAGSYDLYVSHPQHLDLDPPLHLTVERSEDLRGVEIGLHRLGELRLSVLVPNAGATDVANGAEIDVTGPGFSEHRTVDAAVESFFVGSGAFTVEITMAGHAGRTTSPIFVPLSSVVERYFVLTPDQAAAPVDVVYPIDSTTQPVPAGSALVTGVFGFNDPNDGATSPPSPLRSTRGPITFTNGDLTLPGLAVPLDGLAELHLSAPGFKSRTVVVDVKNSTPDTVTLDPEPAQGSITVSAAPAGSPDPTGITATVIDAPQGVTGVLAVVNGTTITLRHPPSSTPLLDLVPVGTYRVRVSAPGHSTEDVDITVEAATTTNAAVALPRSGSLTVEAVGTDSGTGGPPHPVTATFRLTQQPNGNPVEKTGTSVTFDDLDPDATYELEASGTNLQLVGTIPTIDVDPGEAEQLTVEFEVLGTLSGRVLGNTAGTSTALGGVTVSATPDGGATTFEATTAADGTFSITRLPGGTYDLSVVGGAAGWDVADGDRSGLAVLGGNDTDAGDLVLDALPATLEGTVTDGNGNPLAGVSVTVRYSTGGAAPTVTTAADGTYTVGMLTPVPANVEFAKTDFRTVTVVNVPLPRDGTYELDAQLAANLNTIIGKVVASFANTVRDVEGATVDAVPVAGGAAVATTTTAADGTFSLGALPAGDYKVVVTPPAGYDLNASPPQLTVRDGVLRDVGTITLVGKTQPVEVTVVGGDGQPADGVQVTLDAGGGTGVTLGPTTTGADGQVTFTDVVPGTYTARVEPAGTRGGGEVTGIDVVPSDDTNPIEVTITLDEGVLEVSVTFDPVGAQTDVDVTITPDGSTTAITTLVTNGGPESVILPSGDYTVSYSAPGYVTPQDDEVTVTKGKMVAATAELVQFGTITINVTPSDATVTINGDLVDPATFGMAVEYPPDQYEIEATKNGETDEETITLQPGGSETVVLDVNP